MLRLEERLHKNKHFKGKKMMKRFLILLTMLLAMFGCTSYQEAENNSEQGSSNSEQSNPGQNNSEQGNSVNKSAAYKVMHYKQNANDSEYTLVTTDTENKTGTVGDYAYATVKSYEGFTAKQIEYVRIKADGSTVVKIYYDRKEVTLMLNLDGGTGNTMITGKYGANINIQNPTKADYVFSGWEPALPATFPLSPSLHTATWIKESDTVVLDGCTYTKDMKTLLDADSNITSVTIPDSVTSISEEAFYNCSSLASVYITDLTTWCNIKFEDSFSNPLYYAHNLYLNGSLVTDLVIPDSVTSIGWRAFYGCSSLTSVEIPDSVISIGNYAFKGCSSLESVVIPDSVTSIGSYVFYGCDSLTSVTIPDSVTSIGSWAFSGCSSLESVSIGNSVMSIGNYAFSGCSSLASVYITDLTAWMNIKFETASSNPLYNGADLYLNGSLVTDLVIPDGVTSIGKYAFDGCSSLASVIIPDSVTFIGNYAFRDCGNVETLVIGDGLTSLDDLPITSALKSITIGNGVTSIDSYAFNGCSSLESVTIPDSVTSIGEEAFYNCSSLTNVTIPDSVTSIGNEAFYGCDSLIYNEYDNGLYLGNADNPYLVLVKAKDTSITSCGINSKTKIILSNAFNGCENIETLIIGDGITSLDNLPITSALKSLAIPNGVTEIKENRFKDCINLSSITIPASVTSIGKDAFSNCDNLANVYISDLTAWCNIEFANEFANPLDNVANLYLDDTLVKDLVIPDDVTSVSSYAFSGCYSLTNVTIPDNVTAIGDYVFNECSSLTSVTIPDSVTTIGNYAFSDCSSLASVTIPDSVTTIGYNAFSGCSSLTSVVIPDGVTSIGSYAFSDCSSLTSVTIPDSVTTIGWSAFSGCSSLESTYISDIAAWCNISFDNNFANPLYCADNLYLNGSLVKDLVIPNDVTTIRRYAFNNYDTLTSVTISDSVTIIGASAFQYCSSLTSVVIPDNVTAIGEKAFYDCDKLATVTIGNGITRIYKEAFYNCDKLTSATFKDTNNWYYTSNSNYTGGTAVNVTDKAQNATYLKDTYYSYYWYKE